MSDNGYCPTCQQPGIGRRRHLMFCMNGHSHAPDAFTDRAATRRSVREELIESYLVQRVKETGGTVRKVRWDGHPGAPDRLCGWPGRHALVELKRPGGEPEAHQAREHIKLKSIGFAVFVVDSKAGVDALVKAMT